MAHTRKKPIKKLNRTGCILNLRFRGPKICHGHGSKWKTWRGGRNKDICDRRGTASTIYGLIGRKVFDLKLFVSSVKARPGAERPAACVAACGASDQGLRDSENAKICAPHMSPANQKRKKLGNEFIRVQTSRISVDLALHLTLV